MLLAGDIGGTKTNLAIFASRDELYAPLAEASFSSAHYPSLAAVVDAFLAQYPRLPVKQACFGVAGPVIAGQATVTNLPWQINARQLQAQFAIPIVHLLNDLAAIANAIPVLRAADLYTLHEGQPVSGGSIAVIAPGTGLGEAFLTWDGRSYQAYPSEGGHTDFAPTDDWEAGLWRYLRAGLGFEHVSYEAVCSGLGIPHIYDYVKASGFADEPVWLAEQLAASGDRTPVIVNSALAATKPGEICAVTLDTFVGILGAETGNLALKILATGGVYLGGGIPPRILDRLQEGRFMQAFFNKGRLATVLHPMPVYVILNPKAAIVGAAAYGFSFQEQA